MKVDTKAIRAMADPGSIEQLDEIPALAHEDVLALCDRVEELEAFLQALLEGDGNLDFDDLRAVLEGE